MQIVTTSYGAPAWATVKKEMRARDLDTTQFENLAGYLTNWLQFLKEDGIPVNNVSLHNQGDKPYDFPLHGGYSMEKWNESNFGWDYNAYWPPQYVTKFVKMLRPYLDAYELTDVGITPGETWQQILCCGSAELAVASSAFLIGSAAQIFVEIMSNAKNKPR